MSKRTDKGLTQYEKHKKKENRTACLKHYQSEFKHPGFQAAIPSLKTSRQQLEKLFGSEEPQIVAEAQLLHGVIDKITIQCEKLQREHHLTHLIRDFRELMENCWLLQHLAVMGEQSPSYQAIVKRLPQLKKAMQNLQEGMNEMKKYPHLSELHPRQKKALAETAQTLKNMTFELHRGYESLQRHSRPQPKN